MTNSSETPSHRYTVELRFLGDNLEPTEITARLGLAPSSAFSRLQTAPLGRTRRPYWAYNGQGRIGFSVEWNQLEDGLQFLLDALDTKRQNIIAVAHQFEGIWWCGHFQASFSGGPTLSSELMRKLGEYKFPLSIDNYFSQEDDSGSLHEVPAAR